MLNDSIFKFDLYYIILYTNNNYIIVITLSINLYIGYYREFKLPLYLLISSVNVTSKITLVQLFLLCIFFDFINIL